VEDAQDWIANAADHRPGLDNLNKLSPEAVSEIMPEAELENCAGGEAAEMVLVEAEWHDEKMGALPIDLEPPSTPLFAGDSIEALVRRTSGVSRRS